MYWFVLKVSGPTGHLGVNVVRLVQEGIRLEWGRVPIPDQGMVVNPAQKMTRRNSSKAASNKHVQVKVNFGFPVPREGAKWVRSISFPVSTQVCAHSGEPWQELIERSHSPSRDDAMRLRPAPSDPFHKQGTGGWPGVSPWNDVKYIRMNRGQTWIDPGKLIECT